MRIGDATDINYSQGEKTLVPFYNERRFHHTWLLGKTGSGKSTALERWAIDDIHNGDGVAFIDPHGTSIDTILDYIPAHRIDDVILLDLADTEHPVPFNIFDDVSPERRPFVASAFVDTIKSVWRYGYATPQMDMYLYNAAAALLDVPDGTVLGIKYLLSVSSDQYRKRAIGHIKDPVIKDFWQHDFEMPERELRDRTMSAYNKISALISDPAIRNVLGYPDSAFDMRRVLDEQKILLVRVPQGHLGIEKSSTVGALVLAQLHLAALSRETTAPFHVFVDECHHFGTATITEMLSGIRKFGISMTLAHQYLGQLPTDVLEAFLGTAGSIVCFRLGARDATLMGEELALSPADLVAQPAFHSFAKSECVTAGLEMPPITQAKGRNTATKTRLRSRHRYSKPRSTIENRIATFIHNA